MIESSRVRLVSGALEEISTPSLSGAGQLVLRCPVCRVAVWSHYGGNRSVSYVRVGTLDEAVRFAPDVHIFTATKQPWVQLSGGVPSFGEYYDPAALWPAATKQRVAVLKM